MIHRFTVPLPPKGKDRVRFNRKTGATYKTTVTKKWEASLASIAAQYINERMLGPVRVDILAAFPRPKRMLEKWKKDNAKLGRVSGAWKYYPGLIWHVRTPDKDNVEKSVLDALKPFWQDDCQVVCGETVKCYCEARGIPRVEVRIEELEYDEFGWQTPDTLPGMLVVKLGLWPEEQQTVDLFNQ